MKPSLEYLKQLKTDTNKTIDLENERVSLALDLNICPNCGKGIKQSLFGILCDYIKCDHCLKSYVKMNINYDLP